MACYIIPLTAALFVHAQRRLQKRKDDEGRGLSLLLAGGSIFGIVDHWWNGQLFSSQNLALDLALGILITICIYALWYCMLLARKLNAPAASLTK